MALWISGKIIPEPSKGPVNGVLGNPGRKGLFYWGFQNNRGGILWGKFPVEGGGKFGSWEKRPGKTGRKALLRGFGYYLLGGYGLKVGGKGNL